MISPIPISLKEAKKLILSCQGLTSENTTLNTIQQLSYVQIDTISVTERAHNHVLHTRNANFNKEELSKLMDDKLIFEYWSHAAAYLPMSDFRYSLYRKEEYKNDNKHWFPRDKKVDKYVLDRIKAEGPLQSKDFENPRAKGHQWYDWKPSKIALTNLFMDGSIMIKNRQGFQKIFDLTERVLPDNINTKIPTLDEYCKYLIYKSINSNGAININEISYLKKGIKPTINKLLKELIASEEILEVTVENLANTYYSTPQLIDSLNQLKSNSQVHLLSPFDNLIIQRNRAKDFFNFNYLIECYVPEPKRKYGYYTIPILYNDNFIARFDAKADRKTKLLTIKNIWMENDVYLDDDFYNKFKAKIKAFSTFCGCNSMVIEQTTPKSFKSKFSQPI